MERAPSGRCGRFEPPRGRLAPPAIQRGRDLRAGGTIRRLAFAVLLLGPSVSFAQHKGEGRIAIAPGWRWTPNTTFAVSAAAAGTPLERNSPGGPQLVASFGYFADDAVEVGIDLFGGAERLALTGASPLLSTTYGAALGVRFWFPVVELGEGLPLALFGGALAGPTLVNVSGGALEKPSEVAPLGYWLTAGMSARFAERWAAGVEYRFLFVRGQVPGIGSVNAGGSWVSLAITYILPSEPASHSIR